MPEPNRLGPAHDRAARALRLASPAGSSPGSLPKSSKKGIPALSIALVDGSADRLARGFGFADPAKRIPATAETVYRVGSVSKLFTDLAVMQLVEQGKIDLDAPVSRYRPEFAPKNPFNVAITLRQLMSHRSGLVREPPVGHYFDPSPLPSLDVIIRAWQRRALVFEPGTRTKYSNAGITVVGAVVEKVGNERVRRSDRSRLLPPAGHDAIELRARPADLQGQAGPWNDVELRRPDRRDPHIPARHRPGGQPGLVGGSTSGDS